MKQSNFYFKFIALQLSNLIAIFIILLNLYFEISAAVVGWISLLSMIVTLNYVFKHTCLEGMFIFSVYKLLAILLATMMIIYGEDFRLGRFTYYENSIHHQIYLLLSISGSCGFILGLVINGHSLNAAKQQKLKIRVERIRLHHIQYFILCALLFSLLYVYQKGGVITQGNGYGADIRESSLAGFRVGQVFIVLLLAIPIFYARNKSSLRIYSYCIAILTIPILAGARLDFLSPILLIGFIILFKKNNSIFQLRAIYGIIFSVFVYILSNLIGVWRAGLGVGLADAFVIANKLEFIPMGTLNQIYSGIFTVIQWNLEDLQLLYGYSYLEYLYRLIPGFLRDDTVLLDLPSKMYYRGDIMQQGGLHIIGEAVWNFSYLGPFLVMLSFGIGFNFLQNRVYSKSFVISLLAYISIFGLAASSFRIILYNGFVGFRVLTVCFVCFFVIQYVPLLHKRLGN